MVSADDWFGGDTREGLSARSLAPLPLNMCSDSVLHRLQSKLKTVQEEDLQHGCLHPGTSSSFLLAFIWVS